MNAHRITRQQALAVEAQRLRDQLAAHRRSTRRGRFVTVVLIFMAVIASCKSRPAGPDYVDLTDNPSPQLTEAAGGTRHAATQLSTVAENTRQSVDAIRDTLPPPEARKVAAPLRQIDQGATLTDRIAASLAEVLAPKIEEAVAKVGKITVERNEAVKRAKAAETAKSKILAEKNKAVYGWMTLLIVVGVIGAVGAFALPMVFPGMAFIKSGPLALCFGGLVVAAAVVNVYYEKLAFFGMIALGLAGVGVIVLLVVRFRKAHGEAGKFDEWIGDLVQQIEGIKQDLLEQAPDLAEEWFGRGSKLTGILHDKLPKELQEKIRELRESGEIDKAKPKTADVPVPVPVG